MRWEHLQQRVRRRRQRGVTLIELMLVAMVATALLVVAVPSFMDMVVRHRLASATNDFVLDLMLARSEALRRGGPVTICASSDGTSCTATPWEQGRLVFSDPANPNVVDAGEEIVKVSGALAVGDTLAASAGATAIRFLGDGSVAAARVFTTCRAGHLGSQVSVRRVGFVSTAPASYLCP